MLLLLIQATNRMKLFYNIESFYWVIVRCCVLILSTHKSSKCYLSCCFDTALWRLSNEVVVANLIGNAKNLTITKIFNALYTLCRSCRTYKGPSIN